MPEGESRKYGPKLAEGRTAEVFAWDDGRVLKLFREDWGERVAEREATLAQAICDAGAPAPSVYGVTQVGGRWGIIYERIAGPTLLDVLRAHPLRLLLVGQRLAEAHAAMHARKVAGLPSLRAVLAQRIQDASPLPRALRDVALRALDALPDGTALCHGDYHPDNVLLSARGPLVIDWENAALGDPLADVTRTLLLLRVSVFYEKTPVARMSARVNRPLLIVSYLSRYRQLRPCDSAQLNAWELPVTAARLSEGIGAEEEYLLRRTQHLGLRLTRL